MSSVPRAVALCLERLWRRDCAVEPLTPDASDRRYFRVRPADDAPFVLALYAAPFAPDQQPFIIVGALLAAMPVPVPRVRQVFGDLGVIVVDDLGDLTLQEKTGAAPGREHEGLYERAVDHLVTLQRRGAELAVPGLLPYTLAFDVEKLMWEMDFFLTHFVEGFAGRPIATPAREALRVELRQLTRELADEPRVLCHRDYHSRNLMVVGDELFLIDFQDARLGPNTYDLVSLLRDCYVDLDAGLHDRLVARFHRAVGGSDLGRFLERLDTMGVQRHLKALGTFGFQAVSRGNPAYAQYVPRTLGYVRETFARRSRFDRLRDLLAPLVPEVA